MTNNQTPNFGSGDTPFSGGQNTQKLHEITKLPKLPKGPIILAVIVLLLVFIVTNFIYIVAEDEVAVVKVFNEMKIVVVDKDNILAKQLSDKDPQFKDVKVVNKKGLFFKIPFITTVDIHTSKIISYVSSTGQVTTSDKEKFEVRLFAQWEITHPGLYETNFGTINKTSSKIDETLYADIISIINSLKSTEFLTDKEKLYEALEQQRIRYNTVNEGTGIMITDLEIYRVAIPASTYESVYNKMNAERNAAAARFTAEGQKLYAETISNVDLEAALIAAEAIETSATIKGEADAEAVQIYSVAFGKDPVFYEFWRMMQAYVNSFDEDTTIYLDKNNEFLKYFSNMSIK